MATELGKAFKWGFLLKEEDIRRINATAEEHMRKIDKASAPTSTSSITATLVDGSVITARSLDDVIGLENGGARRIDALELRYSDGLSSTIQIKFRDGDRNPSSWTSVSYQVNGAERDWVFLAASEIEERLRRIRTIASNYIVQHRWFMVLPLVIAVLLSISLMQRVQAEGLRSTLNQIEAEHKRGTLTDPIEAILLIERERLATNYSGLRTVAVIGLSYVAPMVFFWLFSKLAPWLFPAYNFYWGDYRAFYDRRRQINNVIWIVIILGLVVSLVAAAIEHRIFV
ncbi:MAG TPA: hypothetical protein VF006_19150 [Longimicrobium sp.]